MKPSLIDTDILSFFFRDEPVVVGNFGAYVQKYGDINLSIITYYEIISGLKHRGAHRKLNVFLEFVDSNTVLPLTEKAAEIAAEKYAVLRNKGQPLEDIDLLIAGIALANDLVLVTHTTKHFKRIKGLDLGDRSDAE